LAFTKTNKADSEVFLKFGDCKNKKAQPKSNFRCAFLKVFNCPPINGILGVMLN